MALEVLYLALLFGRKRARSGIERVVLTVIDWVLKDENHCEMQVKTNINSKKSLQ